MHFMHLKKRAIPLCWMLLTLLSLIGCNANDVPDKTGADPNLIQCTGPRPQVCTYEYRPVCGRRESAWKTYGNACSACADEKVSGYKSGECPE